MLGRGDALPPIHAIAKAQSQCCIASVASYGQLFLFQTIPRFDRHHRDHCHHRVVIAVVIAVIIIIVVIAVIIIIVVIIIMLGIDGGAFV